MLGIVSRPKTLVNFGQPAAPARGVSWSAVTVLPPEENTMSKMRPGASLVPLLLVFIALPVIAQAPYPARNVQIDRAAYGRRVDRHHDPRRRATAHRGSWGKNVVVDNRPGASGMIGTEIATKAEADGHALPTGPTRLPIPRPPRMREKLPFDPARAIVPVRNDRARADDGRNSSLGAGQDRQGTGRTGEERSGWTQVFVVGHGRQQPSLRRVVSRRPRASSSRTSPTKAFRRP